MALSESEKSIGEVVNIGSNYEISILNTFNLIKEVMNSDAELVQDSSRIRPKNSEVERLWCDNTKIKELTGFIPEISLEQGIKKTVNWFSDSSNLAKYKTDIYNV